MTQTLVRSCLRYPGGKSRMVKYLNKFIPLGMDWLDYVEPFVGGGSMFLWVRQNYPGKSYWINDKYYNLYCFWTSLRDNPNGLVVRISSLKNAFPNKESGRELFALANAVLRSSDSLDPLEVAANFYIVNKCSFSGLTQDSSYAPQAYDQNFGWGVIRKFPQISRLLQGVRITNLDYTELLLDDDRTFIYLDPPYDIKYALYGGDKGSLHKGFDHLSFFNRVSRLERSKWLLSYNDNPLIRDLYADFSVDDKFSGSYTMNCPRTEERGKKKSKGNSELVVWN